MGDVPLLSLLQQRIQSTFDAERILFYAKIQVESHKILKNRKQVFKNRKTGATFIGHPKGIPEATSHLVLHMRQQALSQRLIGPIRDDVWVLLWFWFKDYYVSDGSRRNKRLGDLDNLMALPLDCLQKANIITDDSQVCSLDLSRRLPSQDGTNFLEVFVFKHTEPER